MKFNGYHHIGLASADVDKSLKFYTKGLGGKVTFSFPMGDTGKEIYLVDLGGNSVVEIIPIGNGETESNPNWVHIALDTDNAREAFQSAVEAGAAVRSEPQDMMLGTMAVCNAFVFGPDGEVIEFFEVKS